MPIKRIQAQNSPRHQSNNRRKLGQSPANSERNHIGIGTVRFATQPSSNGSSKRSHRDRELRYHPKFRHRYPIKPSNYTGSPQSNVLKYQFSRLPRTDRGSRVLRTLVSGCRRRQLRRKYGCLARLEPSTKECRVAS